MPPLSKGPGRRLYLGIDPGAGGGLASISGVGTVKATGMPDTERDVWDWVRDCKCRFGEMETFAVIEKVGGFIQGNPAPGSAMFKFGAGYGGLRMALVAAGIPFEEVTPQRWQKGLGITPRSKTESKGEWKNRLKARAQQLFPQERVTLSTADALLVAEFCRRLREGRI